MKLHIIKNIKIRKRSILKNTEETLKYRVVVNMVLMQIKYFEGLLCNSYVFYVLNLRHGSSIHIISPCTMVQYKRFRIWFSHTRIKPNGVHLPTELNSYSN